MGPKRVPSTHVTHPFTRMTPVVESDARQTTRVAAGRTARSRWPVVLETSGIRATVFTPVNAGTAAPMSQRHLKPQTPALERTLPPGLERPSTETAVARWMPMGSHPCVSPRPSGAPVGFSLSLLLWMPSTANGRRLDTPWTGLAARLCYALGDAEHPCVPDCSSDAHVGSQRAQGFGAAVTRVLVRIS